MSLRRFLWLLIVLLGLAFLIWWLWPLLVGPPSAPEPAADYGDAPDGDLGMDTGYYAPVAGAVPGIIIFGNAGVAAQFPTVGSDPVPGPFTLDVDEFFIGPFSTPLMYPFAPAFDPANIPSLEAGAVDPADPDGPANLDPPPTPDKADCDKENATHDPAGTGCNPVPPFSINMNGVLVIWLTPQPQAFFLTRVWTSPGAVTEGIAYWNLAFDLDQDGAWEGNALPWDEWIAEDQMFPLNPGASTLLVSPVFEWPVLGAPFGRLAFPVWTRSMVTSEEVADAVGMPDWDGQGPAGGFAQGEVEDYFVEWRPIGQILPAPGGGPGPGGNGGDGGDGGNGGAGDGVSQGDFELGALEAPACPTQATTGDSVVCEIPDAENTSVHLLCIADPASGGEPAGESRITPDNATGEVCGTPEFAVSAAMTDAGLTVAVEKAPENGLVLVALVPASAGAGDGQIPVLGGTGIRILHR